jgi:hypothetical protein
MLAVLSAFAASAGLIVSSAIKHNLAVGKCRVSGYLLAILNKGAGEG